MRIGDYHSGKGSYTQAYDKELKPIPISTPTRLYGMEIELEFNTNGYSAHDRERVASDLSDDLAEHEELEGTFHLERDGSLNYGFEVITHPMEADGFDKWVENPMITNLLDKSHDSGHNGVHVHCTRMQGDNIHKIMYLMCLMQDHLANMTRSSNYAKWYNSDDNSDTYEAVCSFYRGETPRLSEQERIFRTCLKLDLMGRQFDQSTQYMSRMVGDRYNCVNNGNDKTIEFRFFDYTSNKDRLKKYIRFVESLMNIQSKYTFYQLAKAQLHVGNDLVVTVDEDSVLTTEADAMAFVNADMARKIKEKEIFNNAFALRTVATPAYSVGDWVHTDFLQITTGRDQLHLEWSPSMSDNAQRGVRLQVTDVIVRHDTSYDAHYMYELSDGYVYNASWISGLVE